MLTGWDIDILTEAEESSRRAEEFKIRSSLFMEALDVDEVIAHLLVAEGFTKVEEIADAELSELNTIEGFTEDVAVELQNRAISWLEEVEKKLQAKQKELGIQSDLATFEGLTTQQVVKLGEAGVKSKEDLADLAADELVEILGTEMTMTAANELIMAARADWFKDDENAQTGTNG